MNTIQRIATQAFFLTYSRVYTQGFNTDVCTARAEAAEKMSIARQPVELSFYAAPGITVSE